MKDPVQDSGLPQEDLPGRTGTRFPSFLLWTVPLLVAVGFLLGAPNFDLDRVGPESLARGLWAILGLAIGSVGLFAVWSWRTRAVACPRCKRRLSRVGRDTAYAYFPCKPCGVMWRSQADRLPTMEFDDL
jgi:hypothetical protein